MLCIFWNRGFQIFFICEALRRHIKRRKFDLFVILFELETTIIHVYVLFYITLLQPVELAEFHKSLEEKRKTEEFLGAFKKLRKAAISFVMSVFPSTWNNSAPTGPILMKFYIL
jgi:hypothetical protein